MVSSSASDLIPDRLWKALVRADKLFTEALWKLTQLAIVWLGATSLVYHAQRWFGVTLPRFGFGDVGGTYLWGIAAIPVFVIGAGLLSIAILFAVCGLYLVYLVVKHLPTLLGIGIEIWRDRRGEA